MSKSRLFIPLFSIVLQSGCAPSKRESGESVQQFSGPYIEQGYYTLENPLDQAVPGIVVMIRNGETRGYGLLSLNCDSKSIAI